MKEILSHLIESLRDELKEYGEMLALLDRYEQRARPQPSPDLPQYAVTLRAQAETVAAARREREQRQRQVIRQLGLPDTTTFVELLPRLPADYRPLLEALAQDNHESLDRVRQYARQNQLQFHRMVELMECFLGPGFPDSQPVRHPHPFQELPPLEEPALACQSAPRPEPVTAPARPEA